MFYRKQFTIILGSSFYPLWRHLLLKYLLSKCTLFWFRWLLKSCFFFHKNKVTARSYGVDTPASCFHWQFSLCKGDKSNLCIQFENFNILFGSQCSQPTGPYFDRSVISIAKQCKIYYLCIYTLSQCLFIVYLIHFYGKCFEHLFQMQSSQQAMLFLSCSQIG